MFVIGYVNPNSGEQDLSTASQLPTDAVIGEIG